MHVDTDLSAYLDGELAAPDRSRVESHLTSCDRCRARFGELRATASLIGALASPRPRRSLVPRVVERFNWMRPLRSFSTFATGAFLFVFLVTAVGRSGSGLGGGTAAPFQPADRAVPAAAPAAATAAAATSGPALFATPQAVPAAGAPPQDAARSGTVPPGLGAAQSTEKAAEDARELSRTPPPLTDPLLWLGLAVIAAIVAIGAHVRLRST